VVTVEEVLSKAHRPDDLAKRIVQSRKGLDDEKIPVPEDE
jgi:twitching motility protein PilT